MTLFSNNTGGGGKKKKEKIIKNKTHLEENRVLNMLI